MSKGIKEDVVELWTSSAAKYRFGFQLQVVPVVDR